MFARNLSRGNPVRGVVLPANRSADKYASSAPFLDRRISKISALSHSFNLWAYSRELCVYCNQTIGTRSTRAVCLFFNCLLQHLHVLRKNMFRQEQPFYLWQSNNASNYRCIAKANVAIQY